MLLLLATSRRLLMMSLSLKFNDWGVAMKYRLPLIHHACIGVLLLLGSVSPSEAATRPNILFILTDDQGPHAASYLGNKETANSASG